MGRLTLPCCLLAAAALAAPIPKPKEGRFRDGWDEPINPGKDCKFTFKEDSVTIEVPGKPHDLTALTFARSNAPRLLRAVEGDFVMQARVTGPFRAAGPPKEGREGPLVAAGLLLVVGGKPPAPKRGNVVVGMRYLKVEFGNCAGGEGRHDFHALDAGGSIRQRDTSSDKDWPFPAGAGSVYLKLRREGELLTGSSSADGKEWSSFTAGIGLSRSAKVKVGLFARSTSTSRFKVTFDRFKLTPLKPKAK